MALRRPESPLGTLDRERLAAVLPGLSRDTLDALVRAHGARGADEPADFFAWLHARAGIDPELVAGAARSAIAPVLVDADARGADAAVRVIGNVGKGAMGEVLLARDARLQRTVALKRLDPRRVRDPERVRRFVVEAQLTAQLDHPGIVPVHGIDVDADGVPTYTMKLVRGRTLKEWLDEARAQVRASGAPSPSHALPARLEVFVQVCEPIAYAHSRGVLHRDLKPANIMVGAFGEIFVMDWGVARVMGGAQRDVLGADTLDAEERASLPGDGTEVGAIVGTPSYMSPEQAHGRNDALDGRSDLYALGLILQEVATLRRPRPKAPTALAALVAAAEGERSPIQSLSLDEPISRELAAVIQRATAVRPEDRYPDVSALADEVRRVLRGEAVQAAPDTSAQRVSRWVARNRERVVLFAVLAVLGMAAAGASLIAGGLVLREQDRRAADLRTARMVEIAGVASAQSRALDRTLLHAQGLLRGLAGAAERALDAAPGPGPRVVPWSTGYPIPDDVFESQVYEQDISLGHPDMVAAPGVTGVQDVIDTLVGLRPEMEAVLLASVPDAPPVGAKDARQAIGVKGLPIVWSYVATEEGLLAGFPGSGEYPEGYDPRTRPWYLEGRAHTGPAWGRPYEDEGQLGLIVSCTMPVRRTDGRFRGVAALDLTVAYLAREHVAPRGLTAAEGYLVADDGSVVAHASGAVGAAPTGTGQPEPVLAPFPRADVWEVVKAGGGEGTAVVGDTLATWAKLRAAPWTYVVVGPVGELVGR